MISKEEINWYKNILSELEVVFDVGCRNDNVFYELNADLELHLFDPKSPSVQLHGKYNNFALGSAQGTLKYYPEYSSIIRRDELKGEKWKHLQHSYKEIEIETLDKYCQEHHITKIDLLKIDTEGWDYNVLLGSQKMLPNIKYIQFEHWSDQKTNQIKALLKDFKVTALGGKPLNYKAER